jgi:hypothetical protein
VVSWMSQSPVTSEAFAGMIAASANMAAAAKQYILRMGIPSAAGATIREIQPEGNMKLRRERAFWLRVAWERLLRWLLAAQRQRLAGGHRNRQVTGLRSLGCLMECLRASTHARSSSLIHRDD